MAKLKMIPKIERHVLPLETEDGQPVEVLIRQATTGDTIQLANLTSEQERVLRPGEASTRHKWNPYERERYMAFLTLAGCNATNEDDQPIFRFNDKGTKLAMSYEEFSRAWDDCGIYFTDEIVGVMFKTNPQWDYTVPAGNS